MPAPIVIITLAIGTYFVCAFVIGITMHKVSINLVLILSILSSENFACLHGQFSMSLEFDIGRFIVHFSMPLEFFVDWTLHEFHFWACRILHES